MDAGFTKEENGTKKGEMKLVTDKELLSRYYGENEEELDPNERFLRSYILNEGWKEKAGKTVAAVPIAKADPEAIDEEDEQREDEMDNFERQYNFRFEEPNAGTITSHARNVN